MGNPEDLSVFQKLCDEYAALFAAGDLLRMMSLWTDDVILMPPNEPVLVGKEAARVWHQNILDEFIVQRDYSPDDAQVLGDWAFIRLSARQTMTPKSGGAATETPFKEIVVFKREPGGPWKVHWAIWNSDMPLPG
jgi:uncharacterized protein (TIGR02246 family)